MPKLTTEEKRRRGIELSPIAHTQKRRAPWHDYAEVGTYMLTLVTEGRRPLFGRLEYEPVPEGSAPEAQPTVAATVSTTVARSSATVARSSAAGSIRARIALSPLGEAIANEEIKKITRFYPQASVWKLCIMPDHLHIILRIGAPLPKGKHLGTIVSGFKYGCTIAHRRLLGLQKEKPAPGRPAPKVQATVAEKPAAELQTTVAATVAGGSAASPSVPPAVKQPPLFEPGYNDRILLDDGQLDRWKHYLDDNPRRLAIKRLHPDLFAIRHGRQIGQWTCQMVGNIFLLDIPDKMPVIVHRADTDALFVQKKALWLACGERGGVLVSAAIAKREKEVINEAKSRHYRVIHLQENGFPPLYKPSGPDFDACTSGHLLQVSPWPHHNQQQTISRSQCMELNRLAEEIARM